MATIPTIRPDVLRDAYHAILAIGMESLQHYRVPERFEYLAIEIDHLHNLPHYMHEENVYAHAYYYCTTRPFYVERLARLEKIDTKFLISRYSPHWDALRVGLMPFANEINAKHYTERL